jgi:hypothetical protein
VLLASETSAVVSLDAAAVSDDAVESVVGVESVVAVESVVVEVLDDELLPHPLTTDATIAVVNKILTTFFFIVQSSHKFN